MEENRASSDGRPTILETPCGNGMAVFPRASLRHCCAARSRIGHIFVTDFAAPSDMLSAHPASKRWVFPANAVKRKTTMLALKKARKQIEKNPTHPASETLSRLVVALESETPYNLTDLYQLGFEDFALALELLGEWRLDRYYTSKARLLDLSVQLEDMRKAEAAAPSKA